METKRAYKIVRVHPESGDLVDTYTGSVVYHCGDMVVDSRTHGLSVHHTTHGAMVHPVPRGSVGRRWAAKLIEVSYTDADIITRGTGWKKTLVRALRVVRVLRDVHPDIASSGFSGYRARDAQRWIDAGFGGFRLVHRVTRGSPEPESVSVGDRANYVIECRPASGGRHAKSVSYRAIRIPGGGS